VWAGLGVKSQKFQQMMQKYQILRQIWDRLMFWPVTRAIKVEIQIFVFPQTRDFASLLMGLKIPFWPF